MADFSNVKSVAELVTLIKKEHGLSNDKLARETGLAATTIHRLVHGAKADDETLDALAAYANVSRHWIYNLAKGIDARPRYSPTVSLIAALLEEAPQEVAEDVLAMVRALVRKKKSDEKN